jgi:hypothetical protein
MRQIPFWGPGNIWRHFRKCRRHFRKFWRRGDLVLPDLCTPVNYLVQIHKWNMTHILDYLPLSFFFKNVVFRQLHFIQSSGRNVKRILLGILVKGKSNPITGLDRPWGFQEVEAPRFLDNRYMKVVRLSSLRTGHLYPPGNMPGTLFFKRLIRPQRHSPAGRIILVKNSNDTIGNRSRNLGILNEANYFSSRNELEIRDGSWEKNIRYISFSL